MNNNELKEKIKKNLKEEIAISNIKNDLKTRTDKNKKITFTILSFCLILGLGIGIFIKANNSNNDLLQDTSAKLDIDVKAIEIDNLPEKFKFIENISIPKGYKLKDSYNTYIKSGKSTNEYDLLHDYVFYYQKDDNNTIKIAFSDVDKPIRDLFTNVGKHTLKLDDVELTICGNFHNYIVTFKHQDIYFDIDTTGITKNEILALSQSIIDNINKANISN